MVLPLHDDAPLKYVRRPIVNWSLIAINIAVFVAVFSESLGDPLTVIRGFGLIPAVLFGHADLARWIVTPGADWTVLTSLFFHSGLGHLARQYDLSLCLRRQCRGWDGLASLSRCSICSAASRRGCCSLMARR